MVTAVHEGPIQIIRDNPEVIAQILRTAFDVEVGDDLMIRSASEECTQIAPTTYRADNVVEICEGGSGKTTLAVVAEMQQAKDLRKRKSWPIYLTALHHRTACPCYLIVICPKRSVADWAREPIRIGHPGFVLEPLVIGPGTKPLVTTTEQAAQMPELAIISTLANVSSHTRETLEITHAALATIENADHENADLYTDLVVSALPRLARRILEELVSTGTAEYKFKSDLFLRHQALGEAESVLKVLAARDLTVPDEVRERIRSCRDQEQLDEWLARAITVDTADELFD
ncbi:MULTISPECIES: hypothetical protein [unclassified Spirillospora]|uniref:hypothetical protein n=1 Tax=unclassified Spirillospora TaxID=2642701 RepID=UPI0037246FA1